MAYISTSLLDFQPNPIQHDDIPEDGDNFTRNYGYYASDVQMVLNQPGALNVMVVNARIKNPDNRSFKPESLDASTIIKVLIAIGPTPIGSNQIIPGPTVDFSQRASIPLVGENNWAALPCPKFDVPDLVRVF